MNLKKKTSLPPPSTPSCFTGCFRLKFTHGTHGGSRAKTSSKTKRPLHRPVVMYQGSPWQLPRIHLFFGRDSWWGYTPLGTLLVRVVHPITPLFVPWKTGFIGWDARVSAFQGFWFMWRCHGVSNKEDRSLIFPMVFCDSVRFHKDSWKKTGKLPVNGCGLPNRILKGGW